MSSVVKTLTPFRDKEILEGALKNLSIGYTLQANDIITDRQDYYGFEKFIFVDGVYKFQHDSSADIGGKSNYNEYPASWRLNWKGWNSVNAFLTSVEKEYNILYTAKIEKLAEIERKRIEEERKKYIAAQEQKILEKAKQLGYKIDKRVEKDSNIQLVLVKRTY